MKSILMPSFVAAALALRVYAYLPVEDGAFNVRHFHMVERDVDGDIVGRSFMNTYSVVERDSEDVELEARRSCTTAMSCGTPGGCMMMAAQRYCKGESWEKSFQKAVSQTGANGRTGLKIMAEGIGRGPVGMIAGAAKATAKEIIKAKKETKANKKAAAKKASKAPPKKTAAKKAPKKAHKKASPKTPKKAHKKAAPKKATPKRAAHKKAAPKKSVKAASKAAPKKNVKAAAPKKQTKPSAPKKVQSKKQKRELDLDEEVIVNRRDFEVVERDDEMNLVERGEYTTFNLVTRGEDGEIMSRECEMYNGDVSCM